MSPLATALGIIAALITLASLGGALYVSFRASANDARTKRLSEENADYLRRLGYIEPKLQQAEQQNALLMKLHNPTEQLAQISGNQKEILEVLEAQSEVLHDIEAKVTGEES